jgi:hypothetical protein
LDQTGDDVIIQAPTSIEAKDFIYEFKVAVTTEDETEYVDYTTIPTLFDG